MCPAQALGKGKLASAETEECYDGYFELPDQLEKCGLTQPHFKFQLSPAGTPAMANSLDPSWKDDGIDTSP